MSRSALGLHDASCERLLIEEARLIGKLNHRNVVRFGELLWSEDRGVFYLVSEYVSGGSLLDKFKAKRQQNTTKNPSALEAGLPDSFAYICMQAVLDALEHLHVEIGIAHTNLKMESVLFNRAGRVKVGAPLPLSTYQAIDEERKQQVAITMGHQLEVAKANDIQDAGAMMLELITGQTIHEHGGIQNAMSCATGLLKDSFVYHAQGMVKEVPSNRISAGQAAWRMAQCVEDLKARDARFHSWRRTLNDSKILRQRYVASQTETKEESLKRQRLLTCSLVRKHFAVSDYKRCLSACLAHLEADGQSGAVISEAGFITSLVSRNGTAAADLLRLAQRLNWSDRLTSLRVALVKWLFWESCHEVEDCWRQTHRLGEEDDETRCWIADALLEAARYPESKAVIDDIIKPGQRQCVNAHVLSSLAVLLEKTNSTRKGRAAAAIAISYTQNCEVSLKIFQRWLDETILASRHVCQQREGVTATTVVDTAAVEAHRVYEKDIRSSEAKEMQQQLDVVDVIGRTSLVRGISHRVYARMLAADQEHVAAEFHFLLALSVLGAACDHGHPLVLQTREDLADLYVATADRMDSHQNDVDLGTIAKGPCVESGGQAHLGHALRLAAVQLYETTLAHGEEETSRDNAILMVLRHGLSADEPCGLKGNT